MDLHLHQIMARSLTFESYKIFPISLFCVLDFDHNLIHYRARHPNLVPRPGTSSGAGLSSYYSVSEAPGPGTQGDKILLTPVTPEQGRRGLDTDIASWSVMRPPPGHPQPGPPGNESRGERER